MRETWVRSLGQEDPLEKEMTTHPSILAWRIPWMEEPGGLQSTGSQRVRHDWVTSLFLKCFIEFTSEIICSYFETFWWWFKKKNIDSTENVDNRQSRLLMLASASSPAADSILTVYHPCQLPGRLKLASEWCCSGTLWGWSQQELLSHLTQTLQKPLASENEY